MILEYNHFLNTYKYSFEIKIDYERKLAKVVFKDEGQEQGLYLDDVLLTITNQIYREFFKHSEPKNMIFYIYRGFSPKQLSYFWNDDSLTFEEKKFHQ